MSRTGEHRMAMRRNMAASLFEHETISTTLPKAKEVKSFVEKLITLAKKGTLAARRQAISLMGNNRDIVDYEEGVQVKKGTVIGKLFSEIGPRFIDRPGGYTRIIKLSRRRLGDGGQLVLLQLLGENEKYEPKARKTKKVQPEPAQEVEVIDKPQEEAETATEGEAETLEADTEEQPEQAQTGQEQDPKAADQQAEEQIEEDSQPQEEKPEQE